MSASALVLGVSDRVFRMLVRVFRSYAGAAMAVFNLNRLWEVSVTSHQPSEEFENHDRYRRKTYHTFL